MLRLRDEGRFIFVFILNLTFVFFFPNASAVTQFRLGSP